MTGRQILKIKRGQKIGLGGGLRIVCDKRNGLRFFEFRKRVRGKDYSWGVGSASSRNIAGCNRELAAARQRAQKISDAIQTGVDPAGIGKSAKSGEILTGRSPVRDVAEQYVANKGEEWTSERHRRTWLNSLKQHCEWLMALPISEVDLDAVIKALQPHWLVRTETASRMQSKLSRIFSYAVVLSLRKDDPADWKLLSHVFPQKTKVAPVQHRIAMEYQHAPELYAELCESDAAGAKALQWIMLTACRSREGRETGWNELDIVGRIWTIDASRTKERRTFRVPITDEMLKIVDWASGVRTSEFVLTLSGKPLTDAAVAKQLKQRTFKQNTVHGLRTTFRTWCQEAGVEEVLAESCLDHAVGSQVRRAYARSDMLSERARIMSDWAEFLSSNK